MASQCIRIKSRFLAVAGWSLYLIHHLPLPLLTLDQHPVPQMCCGLSSLGLPTSRPLCSGLTPAYASGLTWMSITLLQEAFQESPYRIRRPLLQHSYRAWHLPHCSALACLLTLCAPKTVHLESRKQHPVHQGSPRRHCARHRVGTQTFAHWRTVSITSCPRSSEK